MAANETNDGRGTDRDQFVQEDRHVSPEVWASIARSTRSRWRLGDDPDEAWREALLDEFGTIPNIVVDGDVKGLEDVEGVPSSDGDCPDVERAQTEAYIAVGMLDDAVGPDSFQGEEVQDAIEHLERGLETAVGKTESAQRISRALTFLGDLEELSLDERRLKVRDALAELAPVAAGLSDFDGIDELNRSNGHRPTVPVFYNVPRRAADRAVARFKRRRERLENGAEGKYIEGRTDLRDFIYDEIDEDPVIRIDGETFAAYAGRMGIESMTIDDSESESSGMK